MGYESGVNEFSFVLGDPEDATDPLGTDIYLTKGQRLKWDPVGVVHQDVAVTLWKKDENGCWVENGVKAFSFGVNGKNRHFPREKSWLGWSDWLAVGPFGLFPGKHAAGEIYVSTFDPKLVIAKLKTTREQDVAWLKYTEGRVGTKDRYTVLWNNCVNYTNHEFQDAMNRFREAEHVIILRPPSKP